ncbi:hypothetical protein EYF80_041865 [Liparis tanakae]|uniref:Uncharacterized protein n=1 Tax=Liparis tanakae TaxID=230148 RepID=A0A4Z2G5Q0_9TELE|nr:hypothetical protein EYF80_041865 [Liparis tanakae]
MDLEDDGRRPDERDGRGQLPLVAAAVAARLALGVLAEAELLHAPLRHLQDGRGGAPHTSPRLLVSSSPPPLPLCVTLATASSGTPLSRAYSCRCSRPVSSSLSASN